MNISDVMNRLQSENTMIKLKRLLLSCGVVSSVLYVATDILGTLRYPGYSYANQEFSELTAAGAPTRDLMVALNVIPYDLLVAAFAVGIWISAGPKRAARITAALLVGYAAFGTVGGWLTPMTPRGTEGTLLNIMHIPATAVMSLFMLLAMGFGARLLGKRFRYYSYGTIVTLLVFGVLASLQAGQLAANQATPWMGIEERINIYATLLWVAVLSIGLLRAQSTAVTPRPVPSEGGRESMKQQHIDDQVVPYPKIRRWMAAMFRSVQHKPMMHCLLEVDVTRARAHLREHQAKTGESLSFTAFLTACLAKAVEEHKAVQAIRFGSKHLILFEEVDVYLPIEHDMAGQKQPIPSIIRAANRKTVREIHQEIRAAQVQGVTKDMMRFQSLPTLLFQPYLWIGVWIGRRYPWWWKKNVGTVGLTAVGMFGNGAGWGIPPAPPTPLMMTVGGIVEKPGVVNGTIAIREYLSLTLSFDHDIVDGAPAARFTQRLKDLIESGYGLFDSTLEPERKALCADVAP